MIDFKSKIINALRFIIALRSLKLNALERLAFKFSLIASNSVLMGLLILGSITKMIQPWVIHEHNMSENYENPKTNRPVEYRIARAVLSTKDSDDVNITMPFIWLCRYTSLTYSLMKDWVKIVHPKLMNGTITIKYVDASHVTTVNVSLADDTWVIEGVTEPEPVMFNNFPILTKQ